MKELLAAHHSLLTTPSQRRGGFALIELLVSISIFVIISGALVFSFPTFSSQLVLNNLAHEVALTIREAQVFGIGTREFRGEFPTTHGVYFNLGESAERFVLFADGSGFGVVNGLYDYSTDPFDCVNLDECVSVFSLRRNNAIKGISVDGTSVRAVDITYTRPNPEANIFANSNKYGRATITLRAPGGEEKLIDVFVNGQISVE